MKTYLSITTLLIALLFPLSSHANTFCVSDATGLQTALTTAASNGEDDTIQIVQGTYVGSFIYTSMEAFSLAVEGGYSGDCSSRVVDPVNTVLDANNDGPVLVLSSPDVVAGFVGDGVTLQNGMASGNGGGIYINTSGDVIISNNTIVGNSTNDAGGGVFAESSSGTITLTNNTITGNTSGNGGGVFFESYNGTTTFTNNTITGNSAGNNYGGGVYGYTTPNGSITFTNNTITGNSANSYGGGVYLYNSPSGTITFTNNTITGNSAGNNYGGGVHIRSLSATTTLTNNTITGNSAGYGGGVHVLLVENGAETNIINNIIWNNIATNAGNDLYLNNDGDGDYIPSTVTLLNNDFDQSADGTYIQLPFTIDPSNLDNEDPLFLDALNDDYHLTSSSPCIDTGRLEGAPADDMDGHSRPQGDGVDIGADEYIPPDVDEDGIPNDEDNCINDSNPDQTDTDHDCIGDVCDEFPNDFDPTAPDSDGDGVGNACDVCPYDLNDDIDADGLCANDDNCPDIPNGPELGTCVNTSSGGIGATCMNDGECSSGEVCNNNQEDRDNDGSGDACDNDMICRGLADYDNDVDGSDATMFKSHFGRSVFKNPCPPDGPAPVPKTGQTLCYDTNGVERDCEDTGEDGEYQRGVAYPLPRLTDNEDGTVIDNLTGLIWLKDAHCAITTGHDPDATINASMTWQNALDFVAGINAGNYPLCSAGYTDWRLPNRFELESLLDLSGFPALPYEYPFTNVQSSGYWSSTTFVLFPDDAWQVRISDGDVGNNHKTDFYYVWPVRGGH